MTTYAYKVVPAPTKGQRAKGVKTREGRFAKPEERAPEDATETESGSAAQDDPPKDNVNADPTPEKQQSTGVAAE